MIGCRLLSGCFLQSTQTVVTIITGKHTVFTTHNAGNHLAILVSVCHTLLVDNTLGRSREVWPNSIERLLDGCYLVHRHRSASIALYTTDALTLFVVTAEALGDNV